MIQFTVPSVPVPQPRVKATQRGGHAAVYTPTKTSTGKSNGVAEYKASVRQSFSLVHQGAPLIGPLSLEALFVMPRTNGQIYKKKPMLRLWHDKKPDVDNLQKSLMDALKGLAWIDDNQVCVALMKKVIASGDEQPRVEVFIKECDGSL